MRDGIFSRLRIVNATIVVWMMVSEVLKSRYRYGGYVVSRRKGVDSVRDSGEQV